MDDPFSFLARYRALLAATFVIAAVLAAAVTLLKGTSYTAIATVSVRDILALDGLNGSPLGPNGVPQIADSAETAATSGVILRRALSTLGGKESVSSFRNGIEATLNLASDFVAVAANESDARSAQESANAVAVATASYINQQTRREAVEDEARLNARIRALRGNRAKQRERKSDQQTAAELRTLAIVAAPARATQLADLPTARNPRHTAFYTLLGAVLGLLVGAAAAFLREAFDKVVRRPSQVSACLALPILADFTDDTTLTQIGLLRRNAELLCGDDPPHTLLVSSSDPAAGAGATATELARSFGRVGRHGLLIDANLREPELQDMLDLGGGPGLAECLRGSVKLADAVTTINAAALNGPAGGDSAELACLHAGAVSADADELLASQRFRDLLDEARDSYEMVVVAAAPLPGAADALELVPRADACIVCVRPGHTTLGQLEAARDVLNRISPKAAGTVLTATSDAARAERATPRAPTTG